MPKSELSWGMGRSCQPSAVEQEKLEQWIAAHGTPQQVALRCRIVVAAATGKSDVDIAKQLSVNRNTVILWRKRFADEPMGRYLNAYMASFIVALERRIFRICWSHSYSSII